MQGPAVFIDLSLEDQVCTYQAGRLLTNLMLRKNAIEQNAILRLRSIVYNSFIRVFFLSFQAQELRRYFKANGAEISEEKSNKGIEDDLHKIIGVCDVCFKDGDPVEIDGILNSIVSIMVTVSTLYH